MKQKHQFLNISNTYHVQSGQPGETVAIFGGIHGNETAGVYAIDRFLMELEQGIFHILKGDIIFAYGNEKAMEQNRHNVGLNLNRLFQDQYLKSDDTSRYEIARAKELSHILDNSDILLDIHSTSSESPPFLFSESDRLSEQYATYIPVKYRIIGWSDICGDTIGGDTQTYMALHDKIGFTLECGNHLSEKATIIAYESLISFLSHLGYINTSIVANTQITFRMFEIATTSSGRFQFSRQYNCFDEIQKGELIGYEDGEPLYSKYDAVMLLPNYESLKPGNEIFYYGIKEDYVP